MYINELSSYLMQHGYNIYAIRTGASINLDPKFYKIYKKDAPNKGVFLAEIENDRPGHYQFAFNPGNGITNHIIKFANTPIESREADYAIDFTFSKYDYENFYTELGQISMKFNNHHQLDNDQHRTKLTVTRKQLALLHHIQNQAKHARHIIQ